jgi:hypothetical protein
VKTRKDGTILTFLKPKATTMSLTVGSQAAVHNYKLTVTDASPTISTTPQAPQCNTVFFPSKSCLFQGTFSSVSSKHYQQQLNLTLSRNLGSQSINKFCNNLLTH